jgi:hypothetical protein
MRVVEKTADIAIWLDSSEARIFRFAKGEAGWEKLEHGGNEGDLSLSRLARGSAGREIFDRIARSLPPEGAIVLLGPGITKYHFRNHLDEHFPMAARRVVGCETLDYSIRSDREIASQALRYLATA